MKLGKSLVLFVALVPGGCSWVPYAVHNTCGTTVEKIEECLFRRHLRSIARKVWRDFQREDPHKYSAAYATGFEDGFVEFVDRNGNGQPPAVAPARYRRGVLCSPEGQRDIEDWFAGYRHGARAAHDSGLREQVIVPVSLPPRLPIEPLGAEAVTLGAPVEVTLPVMPTPVGPEKD